MRRMRRVWKFYYYAGLPPKHVAAMNITATIMRGGSQRVAVRVQPAPTRFERRCSCRRAGEGGDPNPSANGVFYTLGDHLGSTSLVADAAGVKVAETRYMPWGETRYTSGYQPSDYLYTGQRAEAGIGLYYYNARWYDPSLGRFAQADTVIPNILIPQAWDHYFYTSNNPLKYIDPSGHGGCELLPSSMRAICESENNNPIIKKGGSNATPTPTRSPINKVLSSTATPTQDRNLCDNSTISIITMICPVSPRFNVCSTPPPGGQCNWVEPPVLPEISGNDLAFLAYSLITDPYVVMKGGGFEASFLEAGEVDIPIFSSAWDALSQLAADQGKGYSLFQEAGRMALKAGEAGLTSIYASAAGGAGMLISGGNIAVGLLTYGAASLWVSHEWDTFNHNSLNFDATPAPEE